MASIAVSRSWWSYLAQKYVKISLLRTPGSYVESTSAVCLGNQGSPETPNAGFHCARTWIQIIHYQPPNFEGNNVQTSPISFYCVCRGCLRIGGRAQFGICQGTRTAPPSQAPLRTVEFECWIIKVFIELPHSKQCIPILTGNRKKYLCNPDKLVVVVMAMEERLFPILKTSWGGTTWF